MMNWWSKHDPLSICPFPKSSHGLNDYFEGAALLAHFKDEDVNNKFNLWLREDETTGYCVGLSAVFL
jgi:hypothetical protein